MNLVLKNCGGRPQISFFFILEILKLRSFAKKKKRSAFGIFFHVCQVNLETYIFYVGLIEVILVF